MRVELTCRWSSCDKEFHFKLYIDDIFVCEVSSFEIVKLHVKKFMTTNYYKLNY